MRRLVSVVLGLALSLVLVVNVAYASHGDPVAHVASARSLVVQARSIASNTTVKNLLGQAVTELDGAQVDLGVTPTTPPPPSSTVPPTTTPTSTTTVSPAAVTVLQGNCPLSYTWDQAHGGCPDARRTTGSGLLTFQNIREDNWEDGWQPVEDPPWSGRATILFKNVYATRIRDDVIENDNFSTGRITDALLDGVHTFLSEQCQGSGDCTTTTISAGEDPNIYIDHVLVRLEDPNSDDREGMVFKWQGRGKPEHHPVVSDSIFAISEQPNAGWSKTLLPSGTGQDHATYTNVYLLWLGPVGGYGGPKPAGTIFQEGAAARTTWCNARAAWLTNHGYPVTTCDTTP